MNFGEKLRVIRSILGLSQQELASRLGTNKQTISRYENSERDPSLRTAKSFSEKLGIDLTLLADDSLYFPTADKIKSERTTRGLSLEQLADRLHISTERLSSIENGEIFPTSLEVASLAKELCLSSDWLLGIEFALESNDFPTTIVERELISLFRKLDSPQCEELLSFARILASQASSPSVEEMEEEYKKRHSSSASSTTSNASNITTDAEKAAGD